MESLSIIVLNFNTFNLTCKCIRSILDSRSNDLDLQIILVDNGSVEEDHKLFTEMFPEIVYVRSESNLGFARGNNLGLRYATKSYVLLLNSDTLVTQAGIFTKSIQIIKEHNDQIVLTSRLMTENGQPQVAYGYLPSLPREILLTFFLHKLLSDSKRDDLLIRFRPYQNRLIRDGYITATFYLFPRKILKRLPGAKLYDDIFLYGEEFFWATQWMNAGIKMYYATDISIVHFIGSSLKRDKKTDLGIRRELQISAEDHYLNWRYNGITVALIYFFRIFRFLMLAPFDKDIRMRLSLILHMLYNKVGRK